MIKILLFLLETLGVCLCLAALMSLGLLCWMLLLRAADYWARWKEEHPEIKD